MVAIQFIRGVRCLDSKVRWPHGGPSAIKVSGCMHNEGGLTRSFDTRYEAQICTCCQAMCVYVDYYKHTSYHLG